MSTPNEHLRGQLPRMPKNSLITGVACSIGSKLLEILLQLDPRVVRLNCSVAGCQRSLAVALSDV